MRVDEGCEDYMRVGMMRSWRGFASISRWLGLVVVEGYDSEI